MDCGTAMKSQWKTDSMEVSKYDLVRAYRATGAVTECGPYERNNAPGGIEWLEPTGSLPEMDCGLGWIAAREALLPEMDDKGWIPSGDGSRPDIDRDVIRMDDRRWMTGDGLRSGDG